MKRSEESGSRFRPALGASPDRLLDAKLHRPPTRPEWVERTRLMKHLDQAVSRPVVLVAAPPGFGKTTMVTQWLASNRVPVVSAWVSLQELDNDPARLWAHVAMALELAGLPSTAAAASGPDGDVIGGLLPHMLRSMATLEDDLVILLDDFHVIQDSECHRQLEIFLEHLPLQAHLVIITRADPGLRLGRLRATGQLAEIRAAELAFTADEASSLLAVEDVQLSEGSVRDLVQRTEGWAAGLYLAALSLAGRSDPEAFIREVNGGNRFIGDYLTEEVLSAHRDEVRNFITTVSILDRFSAPLCDVLTGGTGAAAILHELERTNLFLVPLDEQRTWFRFHNLFASVARGELELERPEAVPALHLTAARWFSDHGHVDEAVRHSLASGDAMEASLLVGAHWLTYVGAGQGATVAAWLEALGPDAISEDPAACVAAAWLAAMNGDRRSLADHLSALEAVKEVGPLPDGSHSVESAIAMIAGVFGYDGPIEMAVGAERAVELETDGRSPFYSIAHLARGQAAYVSGDLDLAAEMLAKASQNEAAPAIIRALSLAMHSLTEGDRGHPALSLRLAEDAVEVVDLAALADVPQVSVAYAALGQACAASGDLTQAAAVIEQGMVLRRRNPAQGPWGALHHLLAATRVAVETGDVVMAQYRAAEARKRMDRHPAGMERMRERLSRTMDGLHAPMDAAEVFEDLTERELDVLRRLQAPRSLTEIAGDLYISPNTVKTHARAIYRKLGATSRGEAIDIARGRQLV